MNDASILKPQRMQKRDLPWYDLTVWRQFLASTSIAFTVTAALSSVLDDPKDTPACSTFFTDFLNCLVVSASCFRAASDCSRASLLWTAAESHCVALESQLNADQLFEATWSDDTKSDESEGDAMVTTRKWVRAYKTSNLLVATWTS